MQDGAGKSREKTNGRKWIVPADIALLLDVTPETVCYWVRTKRIVPTVATPGRYKFSPERAAEILGTMGVNVAAGSVFEAISKAKAEDGHETA